MTTDDHVPGRIVVGLDGSPWSRQALQWAARQARLTGSELHVVTAWDLPKTYGGPPITGIDWEADARRSLEQELKEALEPAVAGQVRAQVIRGHPAGVLVDAAADADLLVVGSRGHGGFAGMLLGSVSQHAVAHARCPVVVVHDSEHDVPA
ncbi:universal stress protein [Geodermatophilus ruber]|uniref:Nucleotide-binding universal stress protein, UspA family n=1 Tax=Geodermatophilus ruber TaxID=504800 RepID=A0A1I4C935_9ACTN|nr:universal stress protein [Geodermatophilus ruber]SFK77678.1 Nucleotide-binding universal stress protein, UspA family [Geodermatophilus ruber]